MSEAPTRFRSPPYPYIGLGRAVERAEQLYSKARHFAVPAATAAEAWGTKITSSSTLQTVAALLQYELTEDEGAREARRFKLSELGLHIVMDKRPGSAERQEALKKAALSPPIFQEIWSTFGSASGLDDSVLIHALTLDRAKQKRAPYSSDSAKEVVRVYRESIAYAGLEDQATRMSHPIEGATSDVKPPELGDLIQWAPSGVLALPEPARVRFISPDRQWVFIDGSETGIPAAEVELVSRARDAPQANASGLAATPDAAARGPAPPAVATDWLRRASPNAPPTLPIEQSAGVTTPGADNIKLTVDGGRVLVTASVDLGGLRRLIRRLTTIEKMLELDEQEL